MHRLGSVPYESLASLYGTLHRYDTYKHHWHCIPALVGNVLHMADRDDICGQQTMRAYALFLGAMEFDSPDDGAPPPELIDPVVQGGLGHNDHVWAMDASVLVQVAQQRDCLQSLAQALRYSSASQDLCP